MDFKLLGSILLIVGTSIGAGMLALPIATAELGFYGSLILLVTCWAVMTAGAFLLLEANLWVPTNSNLISMARVTIGPVGQVIAWITFLLLLYSLLCAYISGGSDLFQNLLHAAGWSIPDSLSVFGFTLIFSSVVYMGIKRVDHVNRALMFVKFSAFFILLFLLAPLVSKFNLASGNMKHLTSLTAITVTITSFGYAAIIPSLRMYFAGDVRKLRAAILIGSLIPLVCYIFWDAVIMGVMPLEGPHGLKELLSSNNTTSDLVNHLIAITNTNAVNVFVKLFTSVCVLTSFLGVSVSLVDFLADGLNLQKDGWSGSFLHLLTFLPPLVIVLFFPNAFIAALKYAGIYCIVLLILLPAWMVWHGRYKKHIQGSFKVPGGKVLLTLLIIVSIVLLIDSVFMFS